MAKSKRKRNEPKSPFEPFTEHELAVALDNYTNPQHPEYDAEFDRTIRKLRPDWFKDDGRPDTTPTN